MSWRLDSRGHGAAGPKGPLLRPHFLCPSLPPPGPLGLACGPHAPSFLFAASPLLSPSFQIPKKGLHRARLRAYTDPWTIMVAAGQGPSHHRELPV